MIYVIGDVQGCYRSLMSLLEKIQFNPARDTLWFVGDLVNRGEDSLSVLRFVKNQSAKVVLGNHDLHLIALAYGFASEKSGDTLSSVLNASDKIELIEWLRHLPLMIHDEQIPVCMLHAGLAPEWTISMAKGYAKEVEAVLQSDAINQFLPDLYGNTPSRWDEALQGNQRLRCILTYFTMLRMIDREGNINFSHKKGLLEGAEFLYPWFAHPNRKPWTVPIVFGHWSALQGVSGVFQVEAIDTGCVWGGQLTALRLPDYQRFSVDSQERLSRTINE